MPSDFSKYLAARPVVRAVAVATAVFAAVVGVAVGISVITGAASAERSTALTELERYAYSWQTKVGTRLTEASSMAAAGAAFASGGATRVPDWNASLHERNQFINNDTWPIIAASLFQQIPGVLSLQVQPSGIVSMMWPPNSAPQNLDTWNMAHLRQGWIDLARGGVPVTVGPHELVQGGMGLLVRYPVYLGPTHTLADLWGGGVVVFRVSDMLNAMNITDEHVRDGYEVICYAQDLTNATKRPSVITHSAGTTEHVLKGDVHPRDSFTVRLQTADPKNGLFMTTLKSGGLPSGKTGAAAVAAVVLPTAVAAALVAAFVFAVALLSFKLKHRHVPATTGEEVTPMALVSVQQLGWWTERQAPEQLAADLMSFEQETARIAAAHGCHLSGRISEGCCLVVSESAANVAAFGRAAAERLPDVMSGVTVTAKLPGAPSHRSQAPSSIATSQRRRLDGRAGRARLARGTANSSRTGTSDEDGRQSSYQRGSRTSRSGFKFAICLHAGALRSTYDPEADRYSFFGGGIAAGAIGVDATQTGEVTATAAFAGVAADGTVRRSTEVRKIDDDDGDATMLYVLEAFDTATNVNNHADDVSSARSQRSRRSRPGRTASDLSSNSSRGRRASHAFRSSDFGGGVASALSAKTGVAVRRRVALLLLELLPADGWSARDRAPPVPNFPEVLETIAAVAARHNGELASVVGGRVVVAFNAVRPVASPSRCAAYADGDIRRAISGRRVVSTVSQGFAHAAVACGSLLVCMGEPVRRAAALLDEAVALNAHEHFLEKTALTDGATAAELRQAFELQCVGPSAAEGVGLRFLLERPWPDDESGDEWLYELQRLEGQSPFTPLNVTIEASLANDPSADQKDAAAAVLAQPRCVSQFHPLALSALRKCLGVADTHSAPVADPNKESAAAVPPHTPS